MEFLLFLLASHCPLLEKGRTLASIFPIQIPFIWVKIIYWHEPGCSTVPRWMAFFSLLSLFVLGFKLLSSPLSCLFFELLLLSVFLRILKQPVCVPRAFFSQLFFCMLAWVQCSQLFHWNFSEFGVVLLVLTLLVLSVYFVSGFFLVSIFVEVFS